MPVIQSQADPNQACPINVEVEGPSDAPVLMMSNSLGTDLHMWDLQAPTFAKNFRLVRYDRRGHGKSGVPKGPYSMAMLGRDALAVMDGLALKTVNWCGLSMGGMVGQWLGANAPERIGRLILSNTHSYYPDKTIWNDRITFAREKGLAAAVGPTMERWFTKEFREHTPDAIARMSEMFLKTQLEGFLGCCAAVRDMDLRDTHARITAPTLVIVGRKDPATPPEAGEEIQKRIMGAKLAALDAAHISNVEQPQAYIDTVLGFLKQ
jgi:3-oxoadipate enol-lactonase